MVCEACMMICLSNLGHLLLTSKSKVGCEALFSTWEHGILGSLGFALQRSNSSRPVERSTNWRDARGTSWLPMHFVCRGSTLADSWSKCQACVPWVPWSPNAGIPGQDFSHREMGLNSIGIWILKADMKSWKSHEFKFVRRICNSARREPLTKDMKESASHHVLKWMWRRHWGSESQHSGHKNHHDTWRFRRSVEKHLHNFVLAIGFKTRAIYTIPGQEFYHREMVLNPVGIWILKANMESLKSHEFPHFFTTLRFCPKRASD